MISQAKNNRSSRLGVRVTDEERRHLLEIARRCGMSVSEYLRRCALDKAPRLKRGVVRMDFIDAYGDFLMELQRMRDRAGDATQNARQREIQSILERARSVLAIVMDDPEVLG